MTFRSIIHLFLDLTKGGSYIEQVKRQWFQSKPFTLVKQREAGEVTYFWQDANGITVSRAYIHADLAEIEFGTFLLNPTPTTEL